MSGIDLKAAQAAQETHPHEAGERYQQRAERVIVQRDRQNYQTDGRYLSGEDADTVREASGQRSPNTPLCWKTHRIGPGCSLASLRQTSQTEYSDAPTRRCLGF